MKATALPRIEDLVGCSLEELDLGVREHVVALRATERVLGAHLAAIARKSRQVGVLANGERAGGLTSLGVTTFPIYLESRGISTGEGYMMRRAAEACELSPDLERDVAAAKTSVPKAALLKDVLEKPELQKPGDTWVVDARRFTTTELRNKVNQRKEALRLVERPVARTLFFSREGISALVRTRELVANLKQRAVSESEANEEALCDFVFRHDPEHKARRARERRERRAAREKAAAQRAASERSETGETGAPGKTGAEPRSPGGRRGPGASDDASRDAVAGEPAGGAGGSAEKQRPRGGAGNGPAPPPDLAKTGSAAPPRSGEARDTSDPAGPDDGAETDDGVGTESSVGRGGAASRHVPAADRHRVLERFGDRCWVAGCDDRGRQTLAHRRHFRFGGANRYWNLLRLCLEHHRQFDGGLWKVVERRKKALLIDRRGLVVGELRGLPPPVPP